MGESLGVIDRYREFLALDPACPAISIAEGNTPLIRLVNLSSEITIYAKFEGLNPTGSFKDRGMTVAISQAVYEGRRAIICASTGNTSAAAAAYAARAGIQAFVIIPEGKIALGKLAQAMMYGAKVLQIKGNFDQGLELVKSIVKELPIAMVNSVNPFRIEGQKTAAFEIIDALGNAPDYHALPVGNAGNITAYWKGYTEHFARDLATQTPKMLGYQASGAAPFLLGHPIDAPETVATAIRIGHPQSWEGATQAVSASQGWFAAVTDQEILSAQRKLASEEGLFCEPASAACIAGVLRDIQAGKLKPGSSVVCTLTGHGLKDPQIAIDQCQNELITVENTLSAVRAVIETQFTGA